MPDIIIIPNKNTTSNPRILFSGSASSSIRLEVLPDGSISFIGSSGSLFGISDNLSGSLSSVNDISGLPIFEVFSDDRVVMGRYNANALVVSGSQVGIGKNPANGTLDISGSVAISGSLSSSGSIDVFSGAVSVIGSGSGGFLRSRHTDNTSAGATQFTFERGSGAGTAATIRTTGDASNGVASLTLTVAGVPYVFNGTSLSAARFDATSEFRITDGGVYRYLNSNNTSAESAFMLLSRGSGAGTSATIRTTGDGSNGVASILFNVGGAARASVTTSGVVMSGSVAITGSLSVSTPFTSSYAITASNANTATSASWAGYAVTASYALNGGGGGAGGATVSAIAPSTGSQGSFWWSSESGSLYVYYNDGNSTQWVSAIGDGAQIDLAAPTPIGTSAPNSGAFTSLTTNGAQVATIGKAAALAIVFG